jgi:hypothetical protein
MCHPDDDETEPLADSETTVVDSGTQAEVVFVSWGLGHPDDNVAAALQMNAFDLGDIHKNFETSFCELLRVSGSANFAVARDCMFSFLEKPGHSTKLAPAVHSSRSAISDEVQEVHEAQILILGTLDDFTKEDLATIDTSLVSAWDEAYTEAEFVLDSFEALANVDVPDTILLDAGKMIFATANVSQWWNNHHCR